MPSPPLHSFPPGASRRPVGARLRARRPPEGPGGARRGRRRAAALLLAAALAASLSACGGEDSEPPPRAAADRFDADRAFAHLEDQVEIGPRPAGSAASRRLAERLRRELPNGRFEPVPGGLRNVVGSLPGPGPAILIGAHYDTESAPAGFVGANDGAAGTAAVVELSRALRRRLPPGHREIRFLLFDGEEEPAGCPPEEFASCGLRGSRAYAAAHAGELGEVIVLDYVANSDLRLPREELSDAGLWELLRAAAAEVGVAEVFPDGEQPGVIDDHYPFLRAGVPSIDLIDFSYPHRDTLEDTPDKLSPAALDAVGEAVVELVIELAREPSG